MNPNAAAPFRNCGVKIADCCISINFNRSAAKIIMDLDKRFAVRSKMAFMGRSPKWNARSVAIKNRMRCGDLAGTVSV
jgi:hypothetical protein